MVEKNLLMLSMASAAVSLCFPVFSFFLFSIPPLTLRPNSPTAPPPPPPDHEAKVSLSVVSVPAAQVSLQRQRPHIPGSRLCQCQSAGKRPGSMSLLTGLIKHFSL